MVDTERTNFFFAKRASADTRSSVASDAAAWGKY